MKRWVETSAPDDPFARPPRTTGIGLQTGWLVEAAPPWAASPERPRTLTGPRPPQRFRIRSPRRGASRFWRPPHPLEGTVLLQGLSDGDRRRLRRAFQSQVPAAQWSSQPHALRHLATWFPTWSVTHWRQIRGPHLFLGATGAGKTTMLFKVARQLLAHGRAVWAVALGPPDRSRQAAFAAQAAESGVSAAFVTDAAELQRVLSRSGPDEAVLFDTPCLLGHQEWLRGALQHPWLRHPHTVLHVCHSLQHSSATQQRVLRCARDLRCDFRALAHVDLAAGIAPLLRLQMQQPRALSFAVAAAAVQEPPLPFDALALFAAFRGDRND